MCIGGSNVFNDDDFDSNSISLFVSILGTQTRYLYRLAVDDELQK